MNIIELPHDWGATKRNHNNNTIPNNSNTTSFSSSLTSQQHNHLMESQQQPIIVAKRGRPSQEKSVTFTDSDHHTNNEDSSTTKIFTKENIQQQQQQQQHESHHQSSSSSLPTEIHPSTSALIKPSPLGPRSTFNAITHDSPEQGQLKQMVLAQLSKKPRPTAAAAKSRPSLEVHCLLSKLPYQKMLSDLFMHQDKDEEALPSPPIPYVTRTYEESFMREPLNSSERLCAKQENCECMFLDKEQPFIAVEFLLPGERPPATPHLCVVCCRAVTQQLYYDIMFDKQDFGGVIQRFGNIHSQPGEYALDAMLIAAPNVALHIMPLPIVSHQRNRWNVQVSTPLYTHWRHGAISNVRKGCIPPTTSSVQLSSKTKKEQQQQHLFTSTNNKIKDKTITSESSTTEIQQTPVFCNFNMEIEEHLQYLHSQLRIGQRHYQSEIDRYLVACRAPRFQHLILPRGRAPHYDNLPDFSFHALSILDPSKDQMIELQQLFLLLRQCTPLRRRTKRAQRELQWEPHSLQSMQHLVQCMQGTLLGLYPTCARTVAFVTRMHVYAFLRSLLISPFSILNTYLQRLRYILKICVMEHMCNTIMDYHPGICHMLNKSGQQLQHFCHAVTTMCDIFRGDINLLFSQNDCIVGTMLQLEKSAHSFFERCTRAYRGIITGQSPGFTSLELFRKKGLSPSMPFMRLLSSIYSAPNQYIFGIVHKDLIPDDLIETFWHLTQCICVYSLPVVIRQRQLDALAKRYPQDTICIERCRRIHVCVYCATKRNITGGQLQCAKLRIDCTSSHSSNHEAEKQYICAHCDIPSILHIDMLGRIAHIGDQKILLSLCCASFIYYRGTGYEFNTECGPQCARHNQFSKGRSSTSNASNHSGGTLSTKRVHQNKNHNDSTIGGATVIRQSLCFVCKQKNIVHSFSLLHVATRAIQQYHLCSKHNLNVEIIKQLDDEYDLVQALRCNRRMA